MTEVAKAAGVSQSTVSRVVNGRSFVGEKTRHRVHEAMERLGYTPQPPDRRPGRDPVPEVRPRSGLLAVLVNRDATIIHSDFVARLYRNVQVEANRSGFSTILHFLSGDLALPELFDRVDAFLIVGSPSDTFPKIVWSRPVIWLTSFQKRNEASIITGNEEVGQLGAEYLIKRGHQRLAVFLPESENPSYQARGTAFQTAASERGIAVRSYATPTKKGDRPTGVSSIADLEARTASLVDRFGKETEPATGIFSPADATTALLYRLFQQRGIHPGKDIEIISCDNEQSYLAGLTPRPATIDLGTEIRARLAVQHLVANLESDQLTQGLRLEIDPILVEGD